MTTDGVRKVTIGYNALNLPVSVTGTGGNTSTATYLYDADGNKQRSVQGTTTRDYIAGIQYENGQISQMMTEEGRAVRNANNTYRYEYFLKDHLGNTRVTIDDQGGNVARVVQADEYYAFGVNELRHTLGDKNNYLYNGKEKQDVLTEQYDYGARFYDPVIGRFTTVDPHATSYFTISPYVYVANNPTGAIDPDGRDLIVLSAPSHVYGLGHAAVLIGNEQTGYRYYSKNGTTGHGGAYGESNVNPEVGGKSYSSLAEFTISKENRRDGPYSKAYEMKTNEEVDKRMELAAKKSMLSDYDVLDKSCVDVASDAATAGGLNPGTPNIPLYLKPSPQDQSYMTPIPNVRFNRIVRNNSDGTLFILPAPPPLKTRVTVIVSEITYSVLPDIKD